MRPLLKNNLKLLYRTKKGECLYEEPGNRAPGDRRLYIGFNGTFWAHTLELIGIALREKGKVEQNNYPNGRGKHYLAHFIQRCILSNEPIKDIMRKFKIPE